MVINISISINLNINISINNAVIIIIIETRRVGWAKMMEFSVLLSV